MASRLFQSRSRRELAVSCAIALGVLYCLFSFSTRPELTSESAWLDYVMNDNAEATFNLESESTFDWSSVKFKYPANGMKMLPKGTPRSLPKIQHAFGAEPASETETRESRRLQVKDLFQRNWRSYREFAWKKDALQPISASSKDQFSGWAATLVDSLDTLWIMGLKEEFNEAVAAVADIDFGQSSSPRVNTFETTIRYLGGLLSAYDLSRRPILLQKATELGDLLYAGFNTENRMPVDFIDFAGAKTGDGLHVEDIVVSASPGTLSMEMTRLSQLTGNSKYYNAVAQVMDVFHKGQSKTLLPGLWPMYVSMSRQDVTSGTDFTLAGCADSLYEYLPKMYLLLGGLEQQYHTMTDSFMETANRHLLFRPMLPGDPDILISGNVNVKDGNIELDPETEHLACYLGGVYALGGRLLNRPDYVDVGAKLTSGCIYTYKAMPTGMGPERWNMVACPSRDNCPWDEELWVQERKKRPEWKDHLPKGFTTAKDPRYILRPEAIESVMVLYRITGQQRLQEAAWEMFEAIRNGTATEYANAAVLDVTRGVYPLPQEDYMESFWLAETLKYFYLMFSPPDLINLDEWVFNTEAHPFRRPL